jgi:hypothetical protein
MRPYNDHEWDTLPHVILTSDTEWNPSVLDNDLDDDENWYDALSDLPDDPTNQLFDQFGNYRHRTIINKHAITHTCLRTTSSRPMTFFTKFMNAAFDQASMTTKDGDRILPGSLPPLSRRLSKILPSMLLSL